jgi:hypothetical protein
LNIKRIQALKNTEYDSDIDFDHTEVGCIFIDRHFESGERNVHRCLEYLGCLEDLE